MNKQLMTVAEAAVYLSVSRQSIWAWVYARTLPSVRLGRCVRLRIADLDTVISEGTTPARESSSDRH